MGIDTYKSLSTEAAELSHHAEERLRAKKGELHLPRTEEEVQRLVHELEVHQIELEMQNKELRQARDEVEKALEKYTDRYDFAPLVVQIEAVAFGSGQECRAAVIDITERKRVEEALRNSERFYRAIGESTQLAEAEGRGVYKPGPGGYRPGGYRRPHLWYQVGELGRRWRLRSGEREIQ